jgi:hypothetical protein
MVMIGMLTKRINFASGVFVGAAGPVVECDGVLVGVGVELRVGELLMDRMRPHLAQCKMLTSKQYPRQRSV